MGFKIRTSEIARFLNADFQGLDIELSGVTTLAQPKDYTLIFSKSSSFSVPETLCSLFLVPSEFEFASRFPKSSAFIKVHNPRLAFAKVVGKFFVRKAPPGIASSTQVGENCKIDETVSIGHNCVLGDNVVIGRNTVINNSVVIGDNTIIGADCYFKSGSIVGEDGFGFDFEEDKTPVRIPHIGRVIIGNNVEIGAKNTIARGTIEDSIIADGVKTDDQIHIAHNCKIGKNTIITACAEISGSVEIGENCWIAPNCTIMNKIKIGNNVVVGIGALIINDLPDNSKHMGFEAIELRALKKVKRAIGYGGKF